MIMLINLVAPTLFDKLWLWPFKGDRDKRPRAVNDYDFNIIFRKMARKYTSTYYFS